MSTDYQLRMKDIVLNLNHAESIFRWIKECYDYHTDKTDEEPKNTPSILIDTRTDTLFCNTSYISEPPIVDFRDVSKVYLDYTLGNKNKDLDIEKLIIILAKYYISGYIILDNDDDCYTVYDMEYIKENIHYIKPEDIYLHTLKVDNAGDLFCSKKDNL